MEPVPVRSCLPVSRHVPKLIVLNKVIQLSGNAAHALHVGGGWLSIRIKRLHYAAE